MRSIELQLKKLGTGIMHTVETRLTRKIAASHVFLVVTDVNALGFKNDVDPDNIQVRTVAERQSVHQPSRHWTH